MTEEGLAIVKSHENMIRDNERMRVALTSINEYARRAVMGVWRQHVADMSAIGLDKSR